MSRLLIHRFMERLKDKRVIAILALAILSLAAVVISNCIFLYILGVFFVLANIYCKKKICWNADHLFTTIDRNYDVMIIGENCNLELNGKKVIRFCSHNRSMLASYELLRRLFSLVDEENGKIIICCREKLLDSKHISALDVPYLHEMQLSKYKIGKVRIKKYFPLLFAPISTMMYITGAKHSVAMREFSLPDYITDFCRDRIRNVELVLTK